jgi:hypothetical protein
MITAEKPQPVTHSISESATTSNETTSLTPEPDNKKYPVLPEFIAEKKFFLLIYPLVLGLFMGSLPLIKILEDLPNP